MTISRRKFLSSSALVGGAALASSSVSAAPYRIVMKRGADGVASGPHTSAVPVAIPATMPMGSGAPLGGIGTGFVEIRADGCFYEWQIFNSGPWAQNAPSTTAPPAPGPQYLCFVVRTSRSSGDMPKVRRLYLRPDANNLYSLPMLQDVESIEYLAEFPMTELRYHDSTLPVEISARVFSPFVPGNERDSANPGFHVGYTLENKSREAVEVSIAGFADNPIASALVERKLTNTLASGDGTTRILFNSSAECDFPSGIGSMCLSVTGGAHSYIAGTFHEYAWPRTAEWKTQRVRMMTISVIEDLIKNGKLPNTEGSTDPSIGLPSAAALDALSSAGVEALKKKLSADALLARIFDDAKAANPNGGIELDRELLKEVVNNLSSEVGHRSLNWGSGALASSVTLKPGEKREIRFTLSWFFPNHIALDRRFMGHMYSNWFRDAGDVDSFLCLNYERHRAETEKFARTLASTSLGDPIAFCWSSQLSTLVFNTWWIKDGSYAIWEGLGCCGLSTTDVDYSGSFPVVALFPNLKLSQMRQIIGFQNRLGQVPHNYSSDLHRVGTTGFMRVDLNPQFVMMVCRDYLWTADRDFLAQMWPHVVRAMAYTESLDTNGDGLPDRNTGLQSYDQWRMRGSPSYVASLWIGALRAAVRIAMDLGEKDEAARWSKVLMKASANFDKLLFNGEYYSLWVDGPIRDEVCMTDQLSGEWFSHLIGLHSSLSREKVDRAIESVFHYNFNPEFGLHNATAPQKPRKYLLALENLQAGGVWSGIEYDFASFLMDHGRYADGLKIVETTHRRYLRAGQPWNQVECGGHYSRAMSSWATMLAATGFKPDFPNNRLTIMPRVTGDFHAPWITKAAYGTVQRTGRTLSVRCVSGKLEIKQLMTSPGLKTIRFNGRPIKAQIEESADAVVFKVQSSLSLGESDVISVS